MANWVKFGERLINLDQVNFIKRICNIRDEDYSIQINMYDEDIDLEFETPQRLDFVFEKFMESLGTYKKIE